MRIYTPAGDLAFKSFTFPDGQPHFKLETYEVEFRDVVIETAIKSPSDLFMVVMAASVLRASGYYSVSLDIRYLMAARMDRAISSGEPFTLELVARTLNSCGFSKVRILDAHSQVATKLIRNSTNVLPFNVVNQVISTLHPGVVVVPDKGAIDRMYELFKRFPYPPEIVYCSKKRDMDTGALSGFKVEDPSLCQGREVLIIDDICDGGGTFVGLAAELRKAGATKVHLYITHGIFSKGVPLAGIDQIFTTDSYIDPYWATRGAVVIPISMKELA